MNTIIASLFLIGGFKQPPQPPDSLSLQYCYTRAAENYTTDKNIDLKRKIMECEH